MGQPHMSELYKCKQTWSGRSKGLHHYWRWQGQKAKILKQLANSKIPHKTCLYCGTPNAKNAQVCITCRQYIAVK